MNERGISINLFIDSFFRPLDEAPPPPQTSRKPSEDDSRPSGASQRTVTMQSADEMSEERRAALRQIEVKVIDYQVG